jgi:hypothetical protein
MSAHAHVRAHVSSAADHPSTARSAEASGG